MDRSAKIRVTPANSINNRLLKLLQYLAGQNPTDGWDCYLEGNAVKWNNIIVSGQSQGGAQAAMLGKIHLLARVAMFGSVTDAVGSRSGPPPAWLSTPGATQPKGISVSRTRATRSGPPYRMAGSCLDSNPLGRL
jgi:hypothetical protein